MVPGLGIQYPNWRYLSTTDSKVHGTKVLGYHGIIGYHSTCGATGHHWVPKVLQYLGTMVPQSLSTTVLGYNSTWVPQYFVIMVSPYLSTMKSAYLSTWVPKYLATMVPWYHWVPWYQGTMVLGYHSTGIPQYLGTTVPQYHGTCVEQIPMGAAG